MNKTMRWWGGGDGEGGVGRTTTILSEIIQNKTVGLEIV